MMPRLSKVKYLHHASLDELNKKVQTRIRAGWELGGPLIFENNEYIQMLMKFNHEAMPNMNITATPPAEQENA